jgi:hypothetical protein
VLAGGATAADGAIVGGGGVGMAAAAPGAEAVVEGTGTARMSPMWVWRWSLLDAAS